MKKQMRSLLFLLFLFLGAAGLLAQTVLPSDRSVSEGAKAWMILSRTFEGEKGLDFLGWAVASPGDLNGDGKPEIMVGMPLAARGSEVNVGKVVVYSGQDGVPLFTLEGSEARYELGFSLSRMGDLDQDGVPDILIGAPGASPARLPQAGSVFVHSGKTGKLLRRFDGQQALDAFGIAVAGGYDFNGDGIPDIVIGAPYTDPLQPDIYYKRGEPSRNRVGLSAAGSVFIFSGKDGGLLLRLNGTEAHGHFGRTIEILGDINGDSVPDIAVSAPVASPNGRTRAGRVFVYSGKDGALINLFDGPNAGGHFGLALARVHDLNGDGIPDLLIGAPDLSPEGRRGAGSVFAYSVKDGVLLRRWDGQEAGEQFGRAVVSMGDLDGDGVADVVIGSPGATAKVGKDTGSVSAFSGKDGHRLFRLDGPTLDGKFGQALAKIDDVNGDGLPDLLIIGAPNVSEGTKMAVGKAFLYVSGPAAIRPK